MSATMENRIIVASAGTGKTYSLTERLECLMDMGVKPEELVALTFSRAAAGEIFSELVKRLAEGVKGTDGKSDVSPRPDLLRKLIEAQHLAMIGTIDSFLMKMVKTLPLELGLQGEVSIMDDYQSKVAKTATADKLMEEGGDELVGAFRDSRYGEGQAKTWAAAFDEAVNAYAKTLDENRDACWGDLGKVWPGGVPFRSCGKSHARLVEGLDGLDSKFAAIDRLEPWEKFKDFVRNFKMSFPSAPAGVKNVLDVFDGRNNTLGELKYNRRSPDLAPDEASVIVGVLDSLIAEVLDAKARETVGLKKVMTEFADRYNSDYRSKGMITFDDLSRLVHDLPEDVKLAIEYRFDLHFMHWALDEFQDTNRAQWKALGNLIDEVIQSAGGEKSIFIVGDPKQAIYGWRGGEVEIFEGEMQKTGEYCVGKLQESWRYTKEIAGFVNDVFGEKNMKATFLQDGDPVIGEVADKWCEVWRAGGDHIAHYQERHGCVKVVRITKGEGRCDKSEIEDGMAHAIADEFKRIGVIKRGISAAVLVRNTKLGESIVPLLKLYGVPAVWEGDSPICGTPAAEYMMALVSAAEHPADEAVNAILKASPIADVITPEDFLGQVTCLGLARALRAVVEKLPEEATSDPVDRAQIDNLLGAAARFEAQADATMRLDAFPEFVASEKERGSASAGVVRVMTIHRSKGLGFEVVAVPELEQAQDFGRTDASALVGGGWVLKNPGSFVINASDELSEALNRERKRNIFEALCLRYVAVTRSKRELLVLVPETGESKKKTAAKSMSFKQYLNEIFPFDGDTYQIGDTEWFADIPHLKKPSSSEQKQKVIQEQPKPAKASLVRRRPSHMAGDGHRASELFGPGGEAATERGIEVHERLAKIEWIAAEEAKMPFDMELVKPDGFVELWRERSYELASDGFWESGQMDRVVFTEKGGEKSATVYDFKTNAVPKGESESDFRSRLIATYAGQMASYRRAVECLTGIPSGRIRTVLLSTAIKKPIECSAGAEWKASSAGSAAVMV